MADTKKQSGDERKADVAQKGETVGETKRVSASSRDERMELLDSLRAPVVPDDVIVKPSAEPDEGAEETVDMVDSFHPNGVQVKNGDVAVKEVRFNAVVTTPDKPVVPEEALVSNDLPEYQRLLGTPDEQIARQENEIKAEDVQGAGE